MNRGRFVLGVLGAVAMCPASAGAAVSIVLLHRSRADVQGSGRRAQPLDYRDRRLGRGAGELLPRRRPRGRCVWNRGRHVSMAIEFSPTAATNFPTGGHLFSPLVATNLPTNRSTGLGCVR